jgi:hypothetical protein
MVGLPELDEAQKIIQYIPASIATELIIKVLYDPTLATKSERNPT